MAAAVAALILVDIMPCYFQTSVGGVGGVLFNHLIYSISF